MKLVDSSFEILEQPEKQIGIWKHIERCGRLAYRSESNITDDSYIKFCKMLLTNHHLSVFEHGTAYLIYKYPRKSWKKMAIVSFYEKNPYSEVNIYEEGDDMVAYITTNMRVVIENHLDDDSFYGHLCDRTDKHARRISVHMICDRGISAEGNRHRRNSITEMSTRYCNFSKNKFGKEISIIKNSDVTEYEYDADKVFNTFLKYENWENSASAYWMAANEFTEFCYMKLLEKGWTPQQARRVLPLDLKTEVIYTAFVDDWKHFFDLRCDTNAHPDMLEIAIPLRDEFIKQGYII